MRVVVNPGDRFGSLIFKQELESHLKGHRTYECLCDCGKIHITTRNGLLTNKITRCSDCAKQSRIKKSTKFNIKENYYTYTSYRSMLDRCENSARYSHVEICEEWKDPTSGFLVFLSDMGTRPQKCTLDRINNSKGYSKENCRWATYSTQNHNKRKPQNCESGYKGVSIDKGVFVVQFYYQGKKEYFRANSELDAATQYDNFSEQHYGDRPNGTEKREILPKLKKSGSVTQDKRTLRFRVRVTVEGDRKTIGYFDSQEEAQLALTDFLNT